ncbi:MAG: hypothetical protein II103_05715 [Treponema sp.]|jgi:hypothetical protein|nr:hypothetical protein [Treponema sp.]MBP5437114.1 hypothetical protein [Treponema sp.]MBP5575663.1 hypothetical protein [Treponema sp.]MBQ1593773.1 hypothetical protein [Treponema sp.]MBQ1644011.1 hypothetical protein [Treponema sp.]
MSAAEKKFILDLPLKVVLTEDGASHFISNKKKLLRFRLADNVEEYGISMEHFSPMSIQNMILVDYISKIEISMSEFVSRRQEIMDLSKVIVYSILYKQFDRQIFSQMIECDCVRHHNRTNPSQLIDEKTRIPEKQLRNILSFKDNAIQQSRQAILEPVWKSIMSNTDYTPEEKNVYLLMTEKFLNRLNLMNWYIITKFYKTEGFSQIMSILRQSLAQYMDKSKVAEYISVMVMELALNSENTNMRKEARILYQGIDNADTLIYDPDIRKKIVEELSRKHEFVSLSWKIGGGSTSIGKQGALNITLYNKEDEFQEVKENIESKLSADLNKRSLIDFYRQMPEGEEGTDLGLYYLSYLEDACKKVNVKFESLVNQFTTSDLTVINLKFNF